MRKALDPQLRLDGCPVSQVQLNLDCRDEIIPILQALQHIYSQPNLRDEILDLIAQDVNGKSSSRWGREGLHYWEILVLAAVRLGCNLNYDKLQDLAEQHRALRHLMGIGDWDEKKTFDWRRIQDNLCKIRPQTIERINHLIVAEGHRLDAGMPLARLAELHVGLLGLLLAFLARHGQTRVSDDLGQLLLVFRAVKAAIEGRLPNAIAQTVLDDPRLLHHHVAVLRFARQQMVMTDEAGRVFVNQHQPSELHRLAGLAALVKLCVGFKDAEQLFVVGDLLAFQYAAARRGTNLLGALQKHL